MMPTVDGFELAKQIRNNYTVTIFTVSAITDVGTVRHSKEMGFDDYITKPFSKEILIS